MWLPSLHTLYLLYQHDVTAGTRRAGPGESPQGDPARTHHHPAPRYQQQLIFSHFGFQFVIDKKFAKIIMNIFHLRDLDFLY